MSSYKVTILLLLLLVNLVACQSIDEKVSPTLGSTKAEVKLPTLVPEIKQTSIVIPTITREVNPYTNLETTTIPDSSPVAESSSATVTSTPKVTSTPDLPICLPPKEPPQISNPVTLAHAISAAEESGKLPNEGAGFSWQLSYDHQNLIFGWKTSDFSPGGELMIYNIKDRTVNIILKLTSDQLLLGSNASPVSDCILIAVYLEKNKPPSYLMLDSQGQQYRFEDKIPGLEADLIRYSYYTWALDGLHLARFIQYSPVPNSAFNAPTLLSLYIMRVDGTVVKTLLSEIPEEELSLGDIGWSPDSQQIALVTAYLDNQTKQSGVFLIDIETGKQNVIPLKGHGVGPIIWSTDGQYVYFKEAELCSRLEVTTGEIVAPVERTLCDTPLPPGLNP